MSEIMIPLPRRIGAQNHSLHSVEEIESYITCTYVFVTRLHYPSHMKETKSTKGETRKFMERLIFQGHFSFSYVVLEKPKTKCFLRFVIVVLK